MRIAPARLRRWLPLALLTLLAPQAHAAVAPSDTASLTDAGRYLLFFGATGDERFQARLESVGKRLDDSLAHSQDAALSELWRNYRQASQKLQSTFATQKLTAQARMSQSLAVEEPLSAYLKAHPASAPSLADNLRLHALLSAREASLRNVDTPRADAEAAQIKTLDASIEQQIVALEHSAPALQADLNNRWHYLQVGQKGGKLLPYPFNAQIDAMLGKLDAH